MARADEDFLRETIELSLKARAAGNHPFGSLLTGPDGAMLVSSGNTYLADKGIGHAELNVARTAAQTYAADFLAGCTLFTSVEPCCMCAGGIYWSGIGRVVFGITERRLAELTGDNPENLTMDMPCHDVFAAGRRPVEVRGPFPELEAEIVKAHAGFW